MSRSTCGRGPCPVCGKRISSNGFGRTSHMRMHVRGKSLVELVQRYDVEHRPRSFRTFEQRVFVRPERANEYIRNGWTERTP